MVEIYLDQVRDLGKAYLESNGEVLSLIWWVINNLGQKDTATLQVSSVVSNFATENLEIYENTNGQIMIRNLSYVPIKNMDDLYVLLREGVIN